MEDGKSTDTATSKPIDRFFSLYSFHQNRESRSDTDSITSDISDNGNFSLSVLSTNLQAAAETDVRKFLSYKLYKGSVYSDEGCVASVEVSLQEHEMKMPLSCYYCLLEKAKEEIKGQESNGGSEKYIICFLSLHEDMLEQPELDCYSTGLMKYLDKETCTVLTTPKESGDSELSQLTLLNTTVQTYLQNWHEETLDYLCRCQALLQQNVKYLLYCALVGSKLTVNGCDDRQKNDIQKFMNACSLTDILHSDKTKSSAGSIDMLVDLGEADSKSSQSVITLDIEQGKVKFTPDDSTKFCEDWAKMLEKADSGSCGQLRQILENGKIKYIQSINMLKRLLTQAETDYYALYRSYMFLKNSGNCDILLHYINQESMPETQNVFRSLQEFIKETDSVVLKS